MVRPLFPAVLFIAVSASGCYLFHERSGPAASPDGGSAADAGTDAGSGDTSPPPPPPPPRCALAPAAERFIASHPEGSMHAPDLFLAGDRVGVVMSQHDTIRHPIVVLSHTDMELTDVTDPRRVGEESHGWGEAAWTGDHTGVCWNGDPGGPGALRFRQIDGLDGELGPRTDFSSEDGPCTELVFAHGVYAMTWRVEHFDEDPTRVETTFALMEESGELRGEPLVLASGEYPGRTPALARTDEGFVIVVYTDDGLRLVHVDRAGRITRERLLAIPNVGYTEVAVRNDRLGLLSLEGWPDTRSLVFRVATLDGEVLNERRIEAGAPTVVYPRVAARPEGWALVWAEGYRPTARAVILSLDPDGLPLAPRRILYEGTHSGYGGPSLLSVDERLYVALSHEGPEPPMGREGIYIERWECTAPAEDLCRPQSAHAGDCAGDHVWGFRWTGDRCAPVVGCESDCIGADCEDLSRTQAACESDRTECPSIACPPTTAGLARFCAPTEVPSLTSRVLEVEVWTDACPCTPEPRCRVEATGERELTVSFEQCEDVVPECECTPDPTRRSAGCVLPPLSPGEWTLRTDGAPPLPITVTPPWETPSGVVACTVE